MNATEIQPNGIMILHPNHWLFVQLAHPICDNGCGLEIFPLTPVEMQELPNGQIMFWHAECWAHKDDPENGRAI